MKYKFSVIALLAIALSGVALGQVSVGDGLKLSLDGDLGFGYTASASDAGTSSHGTTLLGDGTFRGYYYDPKFISFDARPYLNRTQDSSSASSINTAQGVVANASFFSGGHFPGTVSFSRDYNSFQPYGLGNGGYAGEGTGQMFVLGWSALLPKWPTLTANFTHGKQSSSVYGVNGEYGSTSNTLNISSTYKLAGFDLSGLYNHLTTDFNSPSFLSQSAAAQSTAGNDALTLNVSHKLPWEGNFTGSASRYVNDTNSRGLESSNTSQIYSGSATFLPTSRIFFSLGGNYNNNLYGIINRQLIQQGSAPLLGNSGGSSQGVYAQVGLHVLRNLTISAIGNRTVQNWGNRSTELNQVTGTATYNFSNGFLHAFTINGGIVDTATQLGNSGLGLMGTLNFNRRLKGWDTRASIGYTQSIQTLLGLMQTSMYNYTAGATKRFGRSFLNANFFGSHTGLQVTEGSSHAENLNSSFGTRKFSLSGSYGRSNGLSLLTSNGLVSGTTGLPLDVLSPEQIVTFNGKSYGAGGSLSLVPRMEFTVNYYNSTNTTLAGLETTYGTSKVLNSRFRYPMRKLNFNGGYTRISQLINSTGTPVTYSTYYVGISRWFNLF